VIALVAERGLRAVGILMGGKRQDENLLRRPDLIDSGKDSGGGTGFIAQTQADENRTFDARGEVYYVKIAAGAANGVRVLSVHIVEPLRPAAAPPNLRPEHIATSGH